MTTVKPSVNGTAKTSENGTEKKAADLKATPISLKKVEELSPLEDRVLRVQMLGDLVEKRTILKDTIKKLESVKLTSTNRDLKVIIKDSNNTWETFNTGAINTCVQSLLTSLKEQLAATELQITF